jgi:four helix bundle protein
MQDFQKLRVWLQAQEFAARVHGVTRNLTGTDAVSLRSQMGRSSMSVAANIAEGATAGGARQFARCLQMAAASAAETESHLDVAVRVELLPNTVVRELMNEVVLVRRQIIALHKRVREGATGNR